MPMEEFDRVSGSSGEAETDARSEADSRAPRRAGEMTFFEHLEDLRKTLLYCLAALVSGCLLVASFLPFFSDILNWPLRFAMGGNSDLLPGLVTTSPMGVFAVVLQVCFLGGFALALPFMLYFIARFTAPGLKPEEVAILRPGCLAALLLFVVGVAFSYGVLVPVALRASIFLNQVLGFELIWSADRYYGLLVWMTLGIGLSFEFPLLIVILVHVRILDVARLRTFRPYSIIVFLAVAAVITPTTDPITFLVLAIPLSLLYEMAVYLSVGVEKRRARREAEEDSS